MVIITERRQLMEPMTEETPNSVKETPRLQQNENASLVTQM